MRDLKKAIDLIKKFEGFRSHAYPDPVGIPTIGYGTIKYSNNNLVKLGDEITQATAESYLLDHIEKNIIPYLDKYLRFKVNENQYNSLVSFIYNLGAGAFKKSTLLKKINAKDFFGAANEFDRWVYAGGKKLRGLQRRRSVEKALFMEPMYDIISKEDPVNLIKTDTGFLQIFKNFYNWLKKLLKIN